MKARILTLGLAAFSLLTSWAAATGSCVSKAKSLSSSQTATLVNEYDSDEKEYYDSGVMYYKVTLKRGQAYTVWITGGNASSMSLDVDTNWEYYEDKEIEPGAAFSVDSLDGGNTQVAYLYADDWTLPEAGDEASDYDPKEGRYIVTITGDIGAQTTVGFTSGIRTFTVTGTEDSPRVLSMADKWKSYSTKLIEGEYFFRSTLKAGRKYRIYARGGKAGLPLSINIDDGTGTSSDSDSEIETDETIAIDSALTNAYNEAWTIVPSVTAKYDFTLMGDDTQAFSFYYTSVPQRAITAHAAIPMIKEMENMYVVSFRPGHMCSTMSYYDEIVDENLCKIYLEKGSRWVFGTAGASVPQKMYLYNSAGKILATNEGCGIAGSHDTRVTLDVPASGIYYVGVCDPTLGVYDTQTSLASPIILTASRTELLPKPDSFDPVDDVYSGASPLVPYPATTNVAVSTIFTNEAARALGAVHGPHAFGPADTYDCFAINCRKGLTYKLRAQFQDGDAAAAQYPGLTLDSKVFTRRGSAEVKVATTGSLTPETVYYSGDDLVFKATTNATHYIRVWVAEAKGLDYPNYNVYALVGQGMNENALGVLKVASRGTVGAWYLGSESTSTYPANTTIVVPTNAAQVVRAAAVSGFTASAATTVAVPAWHEGDPAVSVTNTYSDVYDAKYVMSKKVTKNAKTGKTVTTYVYSPADGDNTAAGAFAITPAATAATVKRTLWSADPADTFSFTAVTNVFYNFALTNRIDGGDAQMVLTTAAGEELARGTTFEKLRLPVGKTYLTVVHGTADAADSSYAVTYSRAAAGVVGFSATAFAVAEGSEYATLTLTRSAAEGIARVRYATQAGTAKPGVNYEPVTDGLVSWSAGNKANKTIKIRLIPDLVADWAASNLTFTVRLYPEDETALGDGMYTPALGVATTTVKIKEANTKKPGKLSLTAYSSSFGENAAVANTAAPSVKGMAGDTVRLTFARTGGHNGKVALKIASRVQKTDTAKAGTDYLAFSKTVTWEDGDAEPKTVEVTLPATSGFTAYKKFTYAMALVNTGSKPTLAAKAGTFTVYNATVAKTAANYAKTIAASTGLALTSTGTWFTDRDGTLRSATSVGTLTYTLTGPGLFTCEPAVVLGTNENAAATLTCKIGTEKISCTDPDFTGRITRLLGSGKTVVTFTLSGVTGGAYAAFTPQADGKPYAWTRLAGTTSQLPLNKAYVTTNGVSDLMWQLPEGLAAEAALVTRVRFGTSTAPAAIEATPSYAACVGSLPMPGDLEAGKTYYWGLDYGLVAEGEAAPAKWISGSTWRFTTIKDGAPLTRFAQGSDASGAEAADLIAKGEPIELIQGVKASFTLTGMGDEESAAPLGANQCRLLSGTLPPGVTLSAANGGKLSGCPTTPGEYTVQLQGFNRTSKTTTKKVNGKTKKVAVNTDVYGTAMTVTFKVLPAGTSIGSFRGPVFEDGGTFPTDSRHQGLVSFSATAAGALTAKLTLAGVSYAFTAKGYDEIVDRDDTAAGVQRHFRATLKNKTTINKKTYTNTLTLLIADGPTTNATALAEKMGTVEEIVMNVPNAKKTAVTPDVVYAGDLYRYCGGTTAGSEATRPFAGYYTLALVPDGTVGAAEGYPAGNGYLTFTIAATGSFTLSGKLPDGTSISGASYGQRLEDGSFAVPFYVGSASYAVAGTLVLDLNADGVGATRSASTLFWVKNAAATTSRDASGFGFELQPVGGWYDKVSNLQAYYLNQGFAIEAGTGEDLPAEALASGYAFTTYSVPDALSVKFTGNTLVPDTYKVVKNPTTGLADFNSSVNPWNTKIAFTRATGLVSGTFNAWEWVRKEAPDHLFWYDTKQKGISKLVHRGILLFTRADGETALADNVLTAGFFLMPATTSTKAADIAKAFKASLPFNIISTGETDNNVEERDFEE